MKISKYISSGFLLTLILTLVLFLFSFDAFAKLGVGMGAGEVRLTEKIKPGGIYTLPNLRVFNTGDETATYGFGVSYHQENPQLRPRKEWFHFQPETFTLEAEQSQEVSIVMTVPMKAEQGDYFAFLEAGPIASNKPGTSVGIAVATKLFFTVAPANIFQAGAYRISSFFNSNSPWSWVGLGVFLFIIVSILFRKFFSFSIGVKK